MLSYVFLLIVNSAFGSLNCERFHNGTFIFNYSDVEYKIVREGSKQIEYVNNGDIICEYDIIWTSECDYKLFNDKLTQGDISNHENVSDTIYCKIVDISKNTFRVICSTNNGFEAKTPIITKVK